MQPIKQEAIVYSELFQTVTDGGVQLGEGLGRSVYPVADWLHDNAVVKVAMYETTQNHMEWEVFRYVRNIDGLCDWFAPCIALSFNGKLLFQRRTYPVQQHDLPAKIPTLLTDVKPDNFGMLDGRVVCHDYGLVRLDQAFTSRLRKANWYQS